MLAVDRIRLGWGLGWDMVVGGPSRVVFFLCSEGGEVELTRDPFWLALKVGGAQGSWMFWALRSGLWKEWAHGPSWRVCGWTPAT